jgi:uncharacterized membrane protein SirB2
MLGYATLKLLHLSLVACSGALFLARSLGVLTGRAWGGWHPLQQPWLGAKLALLLVYIVLGSLALKRARPGWPRTGCLAAALAVYGFMASVALAHHPLGWWARGP